MFTLIGFTALLGQVFMTLANKYAMASRMAPFNNLENVMTILSDIIIFNYSFIMTDVFGIVIIVVSIFAPVFLIASEKTK